MVFVGLPFMFLTAPTLEELKQFDVSDLVDMLSKHASEYSQLMKIEGTSSKSVAIEEMILNIQAAITSKLSKKSPVTK